MLPLHLRKRLTSDLMERGNQLAFYNDRKLFICCLKKASRAVLRANSYTSSSITQAFYCYSLHVDVSLSQHKLAAVNTANTNYQEMNLSEKETLQAIKSPQCAKTSVQAGCQEFIINYGPYVLSGFHSFEQGNVSSNNPEGKGE